MSLPSINFSISSIPHLEEIQTLPYHDLLGPTFSGPWLTLWTHLQLLSPLSYCPSHITILTIPQISQACFSLQSSVLTVPFDTLSPDSYPVHFLVDSGLHLPNISLERLSLTTCLNQQAPQLQAPLLYLVNKLVNLIWYLKLFNCVSVGYLQYFRALLKQGRF